MSSMIPTRQPSPDLSRPQTMTSTAQAGHHYGHKRQSSVSSVASATSSTLSREDLKVSISVSGFVFFNKLGQVLKPSETGTSFLEVILNNFTPVAFLSSNGQTFR